MADIIPPEIPRQSAAHPEPDERRRAAAAGSRAGGTHRPGWAPNANQQHYCYAAFDLGTNNCRLLIARPHGRNFVVIDAFSRVVRLGEGLALFGRLREEAMDRTVGALKIFAE